jgi:hypothetical protein
MILDASGWYMVADNVVEELRQDGLEPPCERNGVRYVFATLFQVTGRSEVDGADAFFLWPSIRPTRRRTDSRMRRCRSG